MLFGFLFSWKVDWLPTSSGSWSQMASCSLTHHIQRNVPFHKKYSIRINQTKFHKIVCSSTYFPNPQIRVCALDYCLWNGYETWEYGTILIWMTWDPHIASTDKVTCGNLRTACRITIESLPWRRSHSTITPPHYWAPWARTRTRKYESGNWAIQWRCELLVWSWPTAQAHTKMIQSISIMLSAPSEKDSW